MFDFVLYLCQHKHTDTEILDLSWCQYQNYSFYPPYSKEYNPIFSSFYCGPNTSIKLPEYNAVLIWKQMS